ncbi:DUF1643 domain-containing protein [Burkholderia ambifaria]|uniref:DUF1643 domain-containing protein n=1 Tax=Burkholderia ambifaria TaxID=152480 RepID=UPI001B9D4B51|nr:DUF1643 domain-containing protein [Burkholderia ambifaria]MBR7929442.1 DUF1643 domain-containing protein [Burkholderia ambifaria]
MSAVISDCGEHRFRLDRWVTNSAGTLTFAYFGVNPGMAGPVINDHTVTKLGEFTRRHGGNHFIIGNAFTYRATDVRALCTVKPNAPEADRYLDEIIAEADILVPMWGRASKVPKHLRPRFGEVAVKLLAAGKPVMIFGRTADGDPKHPLMLAYETPLIEWSQA